MPDGCCSSSATRTPRITRTWACPAGTGSPGRPSTRPPSGSCWRRPGCTDGELRHFATQELPEIDRVKHYFCGATRAGQRDVVLGEGAAIVFTTADELLDGRPYTPGTAELLTRFLTSPEYARLAAAG